MADISAEGTAYLQKVARLYREINGEDAPPVDGEPE